MFCCIYLCGKHQLRYVLTLTLTYLGVVGLILNLNATRPVCSIAWDYDRLRAANCVLVQTQLLSETAAC